jgi:hypothetical protein
MSLFDSPINRKHQTLTYSNSKDLRETQCLVFSLYLLIWLVRLENC